MNKKAINGVALLAMGIIAGCTSTPTKETSVKPGKVNRVTLLYQSNRQGVTEPCGCESHPWGGVDRELNAINQAKADGKTLLFVDSGNMYYLPTSKAKMSHFVEKSKFVTEMMNKLGLDVLAPAPTDYLLGLEALRERAKTARFAFIGSNVVDAQGKLAFEPYKIIERDGLRFGIMSVTPEGDLKKDGLKALNPEKTMEKYLPELKEKSDFIVLLSQLGKNKDLEFGTKYSDVKIIVGADLQFATEKPSYLGNGKTLLVDSTIQGTAEGMLDLNIRLPFQGFFSPTIMEDNKEMMAFLEKELTAKPNDTKSKDYLEALKTKEDNHYIKGGSVYDNELINLTKEKFGEPNELTSMMKAEKTRLHKQALSE